MLRRTWVAAVLLSALGPVASQEVTVFGLPLGGKLAANPVRCPADYSKRMKLCWVDKPFVSKDGSFGMASLPPSTSPTWAGLPRISISKAGVLERIDFTLEPDSWRDATASIRARFGAPTEAGTTSNGIAFSIWDTSALRIRAGCRGLPPCFVHFTSRAEVLAEEQRKQAQPPRPATP